MIEVRFYWRFAFTITTLSIEEFDQNPGRAKRTAKDGPVFITDHGRHAYVLLTMEEYRKIAGKRESIIDLLAMPEMAEIDVDYEFPRMGGRVPKAGRLVLTNGRRVLHSPTLAAKTKTRRRWGTP